MQEQNFEKQVQNKLDELSLTPSAPVWQKVEQEIRQKKKRRRMLAFWLFPLLLIGAATYWSLTAIDTSKQEQVTAAGKPQTLSTPSDVALSDTRIKTGVPVNQRTSETTTSSISEPITATTTNNKTATNNNRTDGATSVSVTKGQHTSKFPTTTGKKENNQNYRNRNSNNSYVKAKKTRKSISTATGEKPAEWNNMEEFQTTQATNSQTTTGSQPKGEDSLANIETNKEPLLAKPTEDKSVPDSLQTTNKKQQQTPKWAWSVKAGYGIASIQTALLSKSHDVPQLASGPIGNSGFPNSPQSPMPLTAGPVLEKGNAFHIGVAIKRNINKRLAATAGLQYHYFSTQNTVGQTVEKDTLVYTSNFNRAVINQYYRNTPNSQAKKYTNKYHFLELPVSLEWQVLRNLPLKLETGLTLSYLVSSNALVYDPNASIYYHNNKLLNRTQVHFFSGLSYQVWKNKGLGLHVGPYLQYGLTGLQKESSRYHLLSTGIKTQVTF